MERSAEFEIGDVVRRFVEIDDPGGTLGVLLDALDDLPVGVGLLRLPDLTFVYANKVYESWYQADRRPLVGRRLEDALVAAPQVVQTFRDVARSAKPTHFHNAEFVGLKNRPLALPGNITMWDWSIWPLTNAAARVSHLLVSGYDVTAPAVDRMNAELAHEEGVRALLEVSRTAGSTGTIEDFFGELSARVARFVGARKVLFAAVRNGAMSLQPSSFGFDDNALREVSVPCSPQGNDLADRIVYHDYVFRANIDGNPMFEPYRSVLSVMDVSNAVSVCWRVGDQRLGVVAAFNSTDADGFSDRDVYLLKTAAMAAGLVWQHRQDEARLAQVQEQERASLRASAEQKAALERAKADFLRMASHEMRGPINVMSVYATMLADAAPGEASATTRDAAVAIGEKVRELNHMVDQVLEVSRLEDPSLRLNLSTFDLREVATKA
ncbi:MAG TPA: histidine kinase dimerization/phospho-acceptor domain-containing protein, partial [Candidatus Udaeobacter sp.]|nr:histidine kinase dimerization/phospho-acceptor domain-containing protein [Candidatus Udaeobacter sp.]